MSSSLRSPTFAPRRRTALVVTLSAILLAGVLSWDLATTPDRATGLGYSPIVDAPASYQGQQTCTKRPGPGTIALARYLQRAFPVTGSMGLMRACGQGAPSEHKDGRAFDWAADVNRPAQKKAAYTFIRKALASDSRGNKAALARRLGIMYLIYNDTIWSSYRDFEPRPYLNGGCTSRATCGRTLRHLDHVHISLSYAGAAAQTSWYRARNVRAVPVFEPGTKRLDADATAVVPFTVRADGRTRTTSFYLKAGVTYRIVATGTVSYGPGFSGDANCVWPRGIPVLTPTIRGPIRTPSDPGTDAGTDPFAGNGWDGGYGSDSEGSDHAPSPFASTLPMTHGLVINGMLRWDPALGCRRDHTYQAWFTPTTTQRLAVRYIDNNYADNRGSFDVFVARDDISLASLR